MMADMDLQRSLTSVMAGFDYPDWSVEEGFYTHSDPNNNPFFNQEPLHEHDQLEQYRINSYMMSGTNYLYRPYTGGASDLEDSHESDDSSVIIDQDDLNQIEQYEAMNELELEEKYSQTQEYQTSLSYMSQIYQPVPSRPTQQQNNNLPAFETLFPRNRQQNVNRMASGGPLTDSEDDEESSSICRKGKRGAKNVLLWKFLLEELKKGKYVEWTDIAQGTFRFVDTSEISRLWGHMKRKEDMNFEKLSRGIRHYYKSGFMSRQEGTRLIYKFNWNKVPKKFRQFDPKRGVQIKPY